MDEEKIIKIVEAALLAADGPLTVNNLVQIFQPGELDEENPSKAIRDAIKALQKGSDDRGVELKRVASGYRFQVRQDLSQWVSRLWDEKPPRYTRALLETLALVAYKQPVTRGDIEQVRGVSVSQNIMRTLLERDWIKVVGQKEVPGRPSLYGTTKAFLDYFNLKSLDELPPLPEIRALIEPVLEAGTDVDGQPPAAGATEAAAEGEQAAGDEAPTETGNPDTVNADAEQAEATESPDEASVQEPDSADSDLDADADLEVAEPSVAAVDEADAGDQGEDPAIEAKAEVDTDDDAVETVEAKAVSVDMPDTDGTAEVVPLHPGVTPQS